MFGISVSGLFARSGASRAGVGAVLALWCLFSLVGGATRALCLDLGGECSPSAAAPAGPCHDQTPGADRNPGCGSCVDILVPEDAAVGCSSRPDQDLRAPAAVQPPGAADHLLVALENAAATAAAPLSGASPQAPCLRAIVLRI